MSHTDFSVSMCIYEKDNPEWLSAAIESITTQTVVPKEIVLVVDGPITDALESIAKKCEADALYKVIRLPKNQGQGNARRIGLSACSNELVAIMDSDDISVSNRFENQLKKFENDDTLDVVGGNITEFIGSPENSVGNRNVFTDDESIKRDLKKRCPMNLVSVIFKKSSVEKAGGFIDWYCEEDYYLWVRMAMAGMRFANVPDTVVNVRVGKEMYKRRGGWKYFKSEARLQGFMKKNRIIGLNTYIVNVAERFIVQVLLPNKIRGWVFRKFAREKD